MSRGSIVVALAVSLVLLVAASAEAASTAFVTVGTAFKRVDLGTGGVTSIGSLSSGADPMEGLALSSGSSLYGTGGSGPNPSLFRVDKTTGNTISSGGLGVPSTTQAAGLAFDSAGMLWMAATHYPVVGDPVPKLYRVDPGIPTAIFVGDTGEYVGGLAGACDGTVYGSAVGMSGWELVKVNTGTGALTSVGPMGGSGPDAAHDVDIAIDHATGTLWAVDFDDGKFYVLDKGTGAATQSAFPPLAGVNGIAIDSAAQCPPPGGGTPSPPAGTTKKKCKKAKKKHGKRAAAARKCKKRKRR